MNTGGLIQSPYQDFLIVSIFQMGRDSSSVADRVKDKLKMRSRQGCQIGKVGMTPREGYQTNI